MSRRNGAIVVWHFVPGLPRLEPWAKFFGPFSEGGKTFYVRIHYIKRSYLSNHSTFCRSTEIKPMPSFDATVTEIRENASGGCTVVLMPNELETTTDLKNVLIEPKFATNG